MGKDFIPLKVNNLNWEAALKLLVKSEVTQASGTGYFSFPPKPYEVLEVEVGTDGTTESVVRLKNGDFITYDATIDVALLR